MDTIMHRLMLALVALAATAFPAFAYDTPKALLDALYTPYKSGDDFNWDNWDEAQFRSKALNALFDKDAKEANGEVGRLDFDPYIDGQDYQVTELKFHDAVVTGNTAKVEVTFKNFDTAEDLMFSLVKEADGWKVDDVVSSNKDFPYSLKDIMSGPLVPPDAQGDGSGSGSGSSSGSGSGSSGSSGGDGK
jgi:hypothetical protein